MLKLRHVLWMLCPLIYWSSCQWRNWHVCLSYDDDFLLTKCWCEMLGWDRIHLFFDLYGLTSRCSLLAFVRKEKEELSFSSQTQLKVCRHFLMSIFAHSFGNYKNEIHEQITNLLVEFPGLNMTVLITFNHQFEEEVRIPVCVFNADTLITCLPASGKENRRTCKSKHGNLSSICLECVWK